MLREKGRVVAVESDAVWVETVRSSTCGSCAARAGCGHGALASASASKGLVRAVATETTLASECEINDQVDIELPEQAVLMGSLLVYALPLAFAIVGTLVGNIAGEIGAVIGFIAGLASGFAGLRYIPLLSHRAEQFEPRLAAVYKPAAIIATQAR